MMTRHMRHDGTELMIMITMLQARLYRVKIGARNEFGWNYSDEEFVFGTKGAGKTYNILSCVTPFFSRCCL